MSRKQLFVCDLCDVAIEEYQENSHEKFTTIAISGLTLDACMSCLEKDFAPLLKIYRSMLERSKKEASAMSDRHRPVMLTGELLDRLRQELKERA